MRSRNSFTLIELLVGITVASILSVVTVLTINPNQLLKQSRDATRLADMRVISTAVGAFLVDQGNVALGSSSVAYVSIPDSTTTCANLGLPTAPTGWSYHCASSTDFRKVDGTGWIPLNFTQASFGAPLAVLPVDPTNSTSSYLFYAYGASSTLYQTTSPLESDKHIAKAAGDGGIEPGVYELGTSFTIVSFSRGLVGYWTFEDADNASTTDSSGYGNTLNWHGTSTARYGAGRVGQYAANFDGSSGYLSPSLLNGAPAGKFGTGDFSAAFWVKGVNGTGAYPNFVSTHMCGCNDSAWSAGSALAGNWRIQHISADQVITSPSYNLSDNTWHHVVTLRRGTSMETYVDGSLYGTNTDDNNAGGPWDLNSGSGINIGAGSSNGPYLKDTLIDDVRIYSRALSQAEITALAAGN